MTRRPLTQRPPTRTADPAEARQLVRTDGIAVLTDMGTAMDDAVASAQAIFVNEIRGFRPSTRVVIGDVDPVDLRAHTDGVAHGERFPDYVLLACARSSEVGGESYVVDGYEVLDALRSASPEGELVQRLVDVPVDQSGPGLPRSVTPIVGATDRGRTMLRRFPFQRPSDRSTDPAADAEMIDAWSEAIDAATVDAPRFRLAPGEMAVIDNYRMFHGRDAHDDLDRRMWTLWVWTASAQGMPEDG